MPYLNLLTFVELPEKIPFPFNYANNITRIQLISTLGSYREYYNLWVNSFIRGTLPIGLNIRGWYWTFNELILNVPACDNTGRLMKQLVVPSMFSMLYGLRRVVVLWMTCCCNNAYTKFHILTYHRVILYICIKSPAIYQKYKFHAIVQPHIVQRMKPIGYKWRCPWHRP